VLRAFWTKSRRLQLRRGGLLIDGGDRTLAGRRVLRALYWRALAANAVGATLAYIYLSFVAPPQPPPPDHELFVNLGIVPVYFLVAVVVGYRVSRRTFGRIERWLAEDRTPDSEERALVLSLPWRAAGHAGAGWLLAAILFGAQTATHHPAVYVAGVVLGITLAGLTTTGITFLLVERALRPLFALALADDTPSGAGSVAARTLRTAPRLLVSWALGSGVALVAIAVAFLGRGESRGDDLIGPILFLVVAGLFAGGVLIAAAARSVADPVDRVRAAVERVEEGSLEEEVLVDDGGEIGFLQAGFNRMVAGLRDRERIRDAFGTYVDREVAEHILREGTNLAGEEVEVTAMFIDIADFTALAERTSAPEVVATINRLFERAVPIVHEHGGHVDKFVGDGLLAVFGAPRRQADHADQALAAALEIERTVADGFGGELSIGVGLNSGRVVAGNVGGAGRLEFSVIGDAVNVAARVEAATRKTGDTVLLSEHTRALLSDDAAASLEERPAVPLKGKTEEVSLFAPVVAARTRESVEQ
jgi:adenylate cyclase